MGASWDSTGWFGGRSGPRPPTAGGGLQRACRASSWLWFVLRPMSSAQATRTSRAPATRVVPARQRIAGLGQDAHQVGFAQRLQLDANGEATLELRDEVTRARCGERPGRDEQDVLGAHRAVACVHRRAFENGQQVTLHALTADVGSVVRGAPTDLVDLVDEHDAVVLDETDRVVV